MSYILREKAMHFSALVCIPASPLLSLIPCSAFWTLLSCLPCWRVLDQKLPGDLRARQPVKQAVHQGQRDIITHKNYQEDPRRFFSLPQSLDSLLSMTVFYNGADINILMEPYSTQEFILHFMYQVAVNSN